VKNVKKQHRTYSRRTALSFEALEDRLLLSGNVLATLDPTTHVLNIVGDIGNNAIHLSQVAPAGVPMLRVSGDLFLPGPPPNAPDVTTVDAVGFMDFDLSSITSIHITMLDGNDSVVMGTGPTSGFAVPGNITITAGAGADNFAFNNITANIISVTANGPGADTVALNTIKAGEVDVTTGTGADSVSLNAVNIGTVKINTGSSTATDTATDSVTIANCPGLPDRPAIGILSIISGDGTVADSVTGTTAGVVTIAAGNGNKTITLDNDKFISASVTCGNAPKADIIDVSNDTISGSAGLSITAGGPDVHTITVNNDTFTGGGNLNVHVGDGIRYWDLSKDAPYPLIAGNESTFTSIGSTGIGTANISLGKYFISTGMADSAKTLALSVGDNWDLLTLNNTIANNEAITAGSRVDTGAPFFTFTDDDVVGGSQTVTVGSAPASDKFATGPSTATVNISGGTTDEVYNFGDNLTIVLSGNANSLTINLGNADTLTVSTNVTATSNPDHSGAVSIVGLDSDKLTVNATGAAPQMTSLSISLTTNATVDVAGVTTPGDITLKVTDNAQSVAVTDSSSNNLNISAGNGLGGTDSTYFYLNNDTVNNDLNLNIRNGNNTIALLSVTVLDALFVSCGTGINTVFAGNTSTLFGNIDGGPGPASIFWDLGGNSGFTVGSYGPVIDSINLSATTINEGDSVTLTGTFFHPGNTSGHTVTIDWGDGSADTVQALAGGVFTFSSSHRYLQPGVDNITVTVTDSDGHSGTANTSITVNNLPPVMPAGSLNVTPATIKAGGTTTLTGSFTDAGVMDTHTVDINWGDGSPDTILSLGASVFTFSASHQYVTNLPGNVPYTVRAVVTDNYGASTAAATSVTVQNVAPSITSFSPDAGVPGQHVANVTALTLSGTAEIGSTVKLYVGGNYSQPVGTATADPVTGAWSISYTATINTNVSFTVTSTDPAGNATAPSAPFNVTVASTVFTPSGLIHTDMPVFSWPIVPQAVSYDVWLTDMATGIGHVIGSTTSLTLAAPTALSPGHSYRWWVRGDSSSGATGPWSAPVDFTVAALAAPTPIGPSGAIATDQPTFTWSGVGLAAKYDVWLTDQTTGIGQVIGSSTGTSLAAPAALSPGHSYQWWVRGDSQDGTLGPWSVATTFTVSALAAPTAIAPSGTITTDQPTFTWSGVALATKYDVWLTDQTTGIGQVIGSSTGTALAAPSALTPGHSYQWWVRGDSGNGTTGAWSAAMSFSVAALATPQLLAPTGTVNTNQPTFTWSSVPLATKYDLWLTDQMTGTGQVVGSSANTSLTAPSTLTPGHSYQWWVRGDSGNGTQGPWSTSSTFTVAAPGTPVPSAPSGTISTVTPTFTWSSVPQAVKYDVWVDDLTTGTQILRNQNVVGTSLPSQPLTPGHRYRWWVRAIDENGTAGSWSVATDFFVGPGASRRYDI
jgi:hypothetical protein